MLSTSENADIFTARDEIYLVFAEKIEDIYFFEVNTKYISSSAVKKISIFHECVARKATKTNKQTSENADIFTTQDEIYLVFAVKK